MDKPQLRRIAKKRIRTISRMEESALIAERIRELPEYIEAKTVLAFIPLSDEPDITPIIQNDTRILLPYIENDKMFFSRSGKLSMGAFTMEPEHIEAEYSKALMLVPLLGYSPELQRLGRGGGFYDRYIAENRSRIITAGIAFSVSLLDEYGAEPYDAFLDILITPQAVVRRSGS